MTSQRKPVVVGVDGSATALRAVRWAACRASRDGVSLRIVHAYHLPLGFPSGVTEEESVFDGALLSGGSDAMEVDWQRQRELAEESLGERLAGWQEKYPQVRVERDVVHDRPTRALRRCAQTARLVIVGRRGRGGFRDLVLGSTSQQLIHHATSPVAVVRTEDD